MDSPTIYKICWWLQTYRNILALFPAFNFLAGEIADIDSTIEYLKNYDMEDCDIIRDEEIPF